MAKETQTYTPLRRFCYQRRHGVLCARLHWIAGRLKTGRKDFFELSKKVRPVLRKD